MDRAGRFPIRLPGIAACVAAACGAHARRYAVRNGRARGRLHLAELLFGLHVGVWVDRLRRRPIMIAADFGRAALLLLIPIASLLDFLSYPLLVVVAFATGTLTVCFDVSYMSYLPSLG